MNIPERDFWYSDPDEEYATLQAEQLAAADVDWDAREMSN